MCRIPVRVIPNASRTEVVSFCDGILRIRIMEPPDDNRANGALVKFLSKKLGVKTISVVCGLRTRNKVVDFGEGVSQTFVIDRLFRP
ncbi:MAG: DUF167 domain-containing protein [Puniceicoccales bacterium]|jgi:uncharacterized protein (TIGR00251 family)|nr:DUF167 domain-containing protein [Puniceicoccales bacterium]